MNPSGEMYGIDRIGAVIETQLHKSAREIVHTILHEVQSFGQGVVPHDDMVILTIKFVP
jgi:serine phosphatase RsbU (regulator of sigma subunit)